MKKSMKNRQIEEKIKTLLTRKDINPLIIAKKRQRKHQLQLNVLVTDDNHTKQRSKLVQTTRNQDVNQHTLYKNDGHEQARKMKQN